MKKLKLFFSLLMLVTFSVGTVWGEDALYKTALFGSAYNSDAVGGYTGSWSATNDGFKVNLANFNNNNNGWSYVKCGRKNYASVGTITTDAAIDEPITKVVVTVDAVTTAKVNSSKLYVATDASLSADVQTISVTLAQGVNIFSVPTPTANCYYGLYFDCASGSSNGLVTISKIEYYKAVSTAPAISINPDASYDFMDVKQHSGDGEKEGAFVEVIGSNLKSNVTLTASTVGEDEIFSVEVASLEPTAGVVSENVKILASTAKAGTFNGKLTVASASDEFSPVELSLIINVTPTYELAVAVNDPAMGTATIDGKASVYVDEYDYPSLLAEPKAGYEFVKWTVSNANILIDDENSASTIANTGNVAGTITANFKAKACTVLATPVVSVTDKTYKGAKLTWDAVANADRYTVVIYQGASWIEENNIADHEYVITTDLDANTEYTYHVQAANTIDPNYCESAVAEGNFTTEDLPNVTLNLYANGSLQASVTDKKLHEAYALPAAAKEIAGKVFVGWTNEVNKDYSHPTDAPDLYSVGLDFALDELEVNLYAVYATKGGVAGNMTISKTTTNFPTSYGTSNKFTEYTLEGKKFKIQQAYVNGTKIQWRAAGNSNGTGTMYNSEALPGLQSIVLVYDASDANKNFTVKAGKAENPESGTEITPSKDGATHTFDLTKGEYSYFVLANGSGAGYLTSITINYEETTYSDYATTGVEKLVAPEITPKGGNYTEPVEVAINVPEGANVYYTLDGTEPSELNIPYEGPFTLKNRGENVLKVIAIKGDQYSDVVSETYYINLPFTSVSEFLTFIGTTSSMANVTITGVVASISGGGYDSENNNITFFISDTGNTDEDQLQAYKCTGEEAKNVKLGDKVTLHGDYTYYKETTPELLAGNTIISRVALEGDPLTIAIAGTVNQNKYEENEPFNFDGLYVNGIYNTGYKTRLSELDVEWSTNLEGNLVKADGKVEVTATVGTLKYSVLVSVILGESSPKFSPVPGTHNEKIDVTLTAADGAAIYYTTDGITDPNNTGDGIEYTAPIALYSRGTYTIKAIAYGVKGESNISTAKYVINPPFDDMTDLYDYIDANSLTSLEDVTVIGNVSEITEAYNEGTHMLAFKMSQTGAALERQLWVLSALGEGYAENVKVGDRLTIKGRYEYWDSKDAFDTGAEIIARIARDQYPTDLALSGEPTKTIYEEGELFAPAGMYLEGTYNTGYKGEVTEDVVWHNNLTDNKVVASGTVEVHAEVNSVLSNTVNVTVKIGQGAPVFSEEAGNYQKKLAIEISAKNAEHIYYTLDGTDPIEGTSPEYTAAIELNEYGTTTIKAIAVGERGTSQMTEATYFVNPPLSVGEAIAVIDGGINLNGRIVEGLIYRVESYNSTYKSLTYWISDNGNSEDLKVYSGKGIGSADFNGTEDLAAGDKVKIYGDLLYYTSGSCYEINLNNYLLERTPKGEITAIQVEGVPSISKYSEGSLFDPTGMDVNAIYESGYKEKITGAEGIVWYNDLTDGKVVAEVDVLVWATYAGKTSPKESIHVEVGEKAPDFSVPAGTYTTAQTIELTAAEGAKIYYTTDGTEPIIGVSPEYSAPIVFDTYGNYSIVAIANGLKGESQRVSATYFINLPFASFADMIAADLADGTEDVTIQFTNLITGFTSNKYGIYLNTKDKTGLKDVEIYMNGSLTPTEWVTGGQVSGSVTGTWTYYSKDAVWELVPNAGFAWTGLTYKAPTGIAWNVAEATAYLFQENELPKLTNPYAVAVEYKSDNEAVATVDELGAITIKSAGVANISAEYKGEDYIAAEVSVKLTVSAPVSLAISGTAKEIYYEGEGFSFEGLKATATYDDAHEEEVVADEWIANPEVITAAGTVKVTAKWHELTSPEFDVIVKIGEKAPEIETESGVYYKALTVKLIAYGKDMFLTLDGSDPTDPANENRKMGYDVWDYSLNESGKYNLKAVAWSYEKGFSQIVTREYEIHIPLTVSEAIAKIDAGTDLNDQYVIGYVTEDDKSINGGQLTYWLSDNVSTKRFEVYKGYNIDGAPFESKDDLKVGDQVIVKGNLKKYSDFYEFDNGSQLVKREAAELSRIDVNNVSGKTVYEYGDKFDFSGYTATAVYSTDYERNISAIATWSLYGETSPYILINEFYEYQVVAEFEGKNDWAWSNKISFIKHKVSFDEPANGQLTLKMDETPIASGDAFNKSTIITVTATPNSGYELATLTANGTDIMAAMQFEIGTEDVTVEATFQEIPRTYTIAGTELLMGVSWNPAETAHDMIKQGDGSYKLVKSNVQLLASSAEYKYKVVADHGWDNEGQYPAGSGNLNLSIEEQGVYEITFTYYPGASPVLNANAVKTAELPTTTLYYVHNNSAWENIYAFEWLNGTNLNNVAWPGTPMTLTEKELVDKAKSLVYPVYSCTFPTLCNMIIFNNGTGGGINQTADLQWEASKPYYYDGIWYESLEAIDTEAKAKFYVSGDASVAGAGSPWDPKAFKSLEDTYELELQSGEHLLKITTDGTAATWKGFSDLTVKQNGLYGSTDNAIRFILKEAGKVYVTYKVVDDKVTFQLDGNFFYIEDGYYLAGQGKWTVTELTPEMKFTANAMNPGEYNIVWDLNIGDAIQAVSVTNCTIDNWFGKTSYTVDEAHAGSSKTISFNPVGKEEWGAFGGYIWINAKEDPTTGVENTQMTDKAVKMIQNGTFVIIRGGKTYDASGRLIK